MASILSFLLGLLLGAAFAPVLLPLFKRAWDALKDALSRPRE